MFKSDGIATFTFSGLEELKGELKNIDESSYLLGVLRELVLCFWLIFRVLDRELPSEPLE